MKIRIEYCAVWGYRDRATGLVAEILAAMEHDVGTVEIVPSGGGVFEVDIDDERIFSKKTLGRHAEPGEVMRLLTERT